MEHIIEFINRRRRQLIVHSVIYYRFNDNLIMDHDFDMWSKELVEVQNKHPDIAKQCVFANLFDGFRGETGYHLANEPWGVSKATYLLNLYGRLNNQP